MVSKPTALLQGTLYLLILKILDLEPRTGWAVSQRLRQMSNETLQASHGSLYPALHKLEHEGWILGVWKEAETGRPVKVYSLTRAGRRQLRLETANWTRLSEASTEFWNRSRHRRKHALPPSTVAEMAGRLQAIASRA